MSLSGLRPNQRMPQSGFQRAMTLLELLVVLSVIAILAAILFPVFSLSRNYARRAVCSNNQHQIGIAFHIYVQDNDSRYPAAPVAVQNAYNESADGYYALHDGFCEGAVAGQLSWTDLVSPYITSSTLFYNNDAPRPTSSLFYCPADLDPPGRLALLNPSQGTPSTSYTYKLWLALKRSETEVPKPHAMALLWEQKDFHSGGTNNDSARQSDMNVLFLDGHSRWKHLADTTTSQQVLRADNVLVSSSGPDLNSFYEGAGQDQDNYGEDFVN